MKKQIDLEQIKENNTKRAISKKYAYYTDERGDKVRCRIS